MQCTTKIVGVLLVFGLTSCGPQVGTDSVDAMLPVRGYFTTCGFNTKLEGYTDFCAAFKKSSFPDQVGNPDLEGGPNQVRAILVLSNAAMQTYLQKLSVSSVDVLTSAQADALIRQQVLKGRPLENTTLNTLAGGTVSFTKSGDKLLANGKGVVTGNAPDLEKLRTFYFYRVDAVLE